MECVSLLAHSPNAGAISCYFLARVDTPALALICATVVGAGVEVKGTVVVVVTVTTGAAGIGAWDGVDETWVVVFHCWYYMQLPAQVDPRMG